MRFRIYLALNSCTPQCPPQVSRIVRCLLDDLIILGAVAALRRLCVRTDKGQGEVLHSSFEGSLLTREFEMFEKFSFPASNDTLTPFDARRRDRQGGGDGRTQCYQPRRL